jgi:hypothetical protein
MIALGGAPLRDPSDPHGGRRGRRGAGEILAALRVPRCSSSPGAAPEDFVVAPTFFFLATFSSPIAGDLFVLVADAFSGGASRAAKRHAASGRSSRRPSGSPCRSWSRGPLPRTSGLRAGRRSSWWLLAVPVPLSAYRIIGLRGTERAVGLAPSRRWGFSSTALACRRLAFSAAEGTAAAPSAALPRLASGAVPVALLTAPRRRLPADVPFPVPDSRLYRRRRGCASPWPP